MRTPSVLVSRSIASATARSSSGRARAEITKPGRPRFIWAGAVQTSSAPAATHAAAAGGGGGRELGKQVVEVGLDQRHPRGTGRLDADDRPHHVRDRLEIAASR